MRARWAGWPSRISTTLRPVASLTRRRMKSRKTKAGEALLEDAEAQRAGVGDGGDHVGRKALAGARGHGRLADRRPRAPGAVVGAQARLVDREDLGALAAGGPSRSPGRSPLASAVRPRRTAR